LVFFFLRLAGQHDDRRPNALVAQLPASVEAVHIGQADI
jgi:hypothetical protein